MTSSSLGNFSLETGVHVNWLVGVSTVDINGFIIFEILSYSFDSVLICNFLFL